MQTYMQVSVSNVSFSWVNSMWIHSHSSSDSSIPFIHIQKLLHKLLKNIMQRLKMSKNSLAAKNPVWVCWKPRQTLLKKPLSTSRKNEVVPKPFQIHLQMQSMQQVSFADKKNVLSMTLIIKLLCTHHAKSRKPSKTSRSQIWCHHSTSNSELSTTIMLSTPKGGR